MCRYNSDALDLDFNVAAASATYAVIGLICVMGAIGGMATAKQILMARKNNRLNKQIISRTEAIKSMQDDERNLLADDLESFPLFDDQSVELQEIKVSADVKPAAKTSSARGIAFPCQSP